MSEIRELKKWEYFIIEQEAKASCFVFCQKAGNGI